MPFNERAQTLETAARLEDAVETCSSSLTGLHTEYAANVVRIAAFYEQEMRPYQTVVYAARERAGLAELRADWLERRILVQARAGTFLEARDLRPAAVALLEAAREPLLRAYAALQECEAAELTTLRGYETPPEAALETMRAVLDLRGELEDDHDANKVWAAARVYLTSGYLRSFFAARSEGMLGRADFPPAARMRRLEAFCRDPTHEPRALARVGAAIGALGAWLRAVRDVYRVRLATAPVLLTEGDPAEAREILDDATFGEDRARFEKDAPADPQDEPPNPLAPEDAPPALDRLECEAREMIEAYRDTKNRIAQFTQPVAVSHVALRRMRHYLNWLEENNREAREAMEAIQREAAGKLNELRKKYDGTMLPLEGRLEKKVADFIKVLHGEELENSCK